MFGIFKFTALMFRSFIGVTTTVSKAAGTAIGAGVVAAEVIKDYKKESDAKNGEGTSNEKCRSAGDPV